MWSVIRFLEWVLDDDVCLFVNFASPDSKKSSFCCCSTALPPSRLYFNMPSFKYWLLFSKSVFGNDCCLFINFASSDPNESCCATLLQHHHHLHPTHLIKSETRFTWGVFPLIQREAYLQETAEEKMREQLSGKNSKRERNKTKTRNLPLLYFSSTGLQSRAWKYSGAC